MVLALVSLAFSLAALFVVIAGVREASRLREACEARRGQFGGGDGGRAGEPGQPGGVWPPLRGMPDYTTR